VTPVEMAVVGLVLATGACIQGGVGFGMNLLAAPVLAIIDPRLVPAPLLVAAVTLTLLVAHRERRSVDLPGVGWALTGRVPGTVAGALLIANLDRRSVVVAVGISVLVACVLTATRLPLRPRPATLLTAGVVSGFSGTISSVGGPPMAVVYAHEPGPVVRGTLAVIFVVGGIISVASLAVVGRVGRYEVLASLALQPPLLAGYALSPRLARHLDAGRTRAAVVAVAAVGAASVLLRELAR
jgi:uncharacterized protein